MEKIIFWANLAAGGALVSIFLTIVFVLACRRDFRVSLLIPAFASSLCAIGITLILSPVNDLCAYSIAGAFLAGFAAIVLMPVACLAWRIAWHLARDPDNETDDL